jgi:CRISPR-associated endonuclease Cas2
LLLNSSVIINPKKMKSKNINRPKAEHTIIKCIINKIPTVTVWIFSFLFEMGAVTIDAFLSPSYYADFPGYKGDFVAFPKKKSKIKEITIRQSIRRLTKQGFVEKNGNKYQLTEKGRKLGRYISEIKNIARKKWDGKYRLVIFDIPEEKSDERNWLRRELSLLGYRFLQKSVFIGKHPLPKDLIKSIKKRKIGNFVNYVLAEKVYKNII